jgi:hypothetical protein
MRLYIFILEYVYVMVSHLLVSVRAYAHVVSVMDTDYVSSSIFGFKPRSVK